MDQKSIPIEDNSAAPLGFWAQWREEHESLLRDIRLSFYLFSRSPLSVIGMILVGTFLLIALIIRLITLIIGMMTLIISHHYIEEIEKINIKVYRIVILLSVIIPLDGIAIALSFYQSIK